VKEVSRGFSDSSRIDPNRLRQAVQDDLMREKLMGWLESNATISEKSSDAAEAKEEKPKQAAAKKSSSKKAKAESESTAEA